MTRVILLYSLAPGQRYPMHAQCGSQTLGFACGCMHPIFYYIGQHRTVAEIPPQADDITNHQLPIN